MRSPRAEPLRDTILGVRKLKILPYASYTEPTSSYPEEMEAAITLLSAEHRRSKGTGLIIRKAAETVAWVSRFVWPLLALPVDFPAAVEAETTDEAEQSPRPGRRVLLFDLTGLNASALAPFRLREDLDPPAQVAASADLAAADFVTVIEDLTRSFGTGQRTLMGAFTTVRGIVQRSPGGEQIDGFLSGQPPLAHDLIRHLGESAPASWEAPELARSITTAEAEQVAEEIGERVRAYLAQAGKIEELAASLNHTARRYPGDLAQQRERISADYAVQIDVVRPEVERAIAAHQRGLEERLNALAQQFSGTAAAQEADVSRADRDVDRFRSLGKEYEGQLAEARRIKQETQKKLDATNRDRDNAAKKARDHYRALIDEENDKLNELVKARDREIAALNELERKLETSLREFRSAVAAAAEQDRKHASELAGLAITSTVADSAEPVEFGLPVYVIRYDGPRVRYAVLSPFLLDSPKGVGRLVRDVSKAVSGLFGSLSLPADSRSPRYESAFARPLVAALESTAPPDAAAVGAAASVNEKAASADVLDRSDFREVALKGLEALKAGGWLRGQQYEEQRQAVLRLYGIFPEPEEQPAVAEGEVAEPAPTATEPVQAKPAKPTPPTEPAGGPAAEAPADRPVAPREDEEQAGERKPE